MSESIRFGLAAPGTDHPGRPIRDRNRQSDAAGPALWTGRLAVRLSRTVQPN